MKILEVGQWLDLGNGRVGLVAEVEDGMVHVELPGGQIVDRPLAFGLVHWRRVADDGVMVRRALDPQGLVALAESAPAEVIVGMIRDLGGEATTASLRDALSPDPIPSEEYTGWWRRVQSKLETDPRIDPTMARQRRYRLRFNYDTGERYLSVEGFFPV